MIDCSTAKSKMFPYVDGELGREARDQVEAHLAHCGACRRLVDLEVAFRETYVEPLRPDPAPERVREKLGALLSGLEGERRAGRRRVGVRRLAFGLAAAVLVASGV